MLTLSLVSLALALPGGGAALHVPGDFATVQEAIDAASPDATIVVHGGTYESLRIDKPLTILGDPAPFFVPYDGGSYIAAPAVTLAGPGAGRVVLAEVRVGGGVDPWRFSYASPGIVGGGFDELHVYHSEVHAPGWGWEVTGVAQGVTAIATTVPWILLSDTRVGASWTLNTGECVGYGPPSAAGLSAGGSTVILLDSSVWGGSSQSNCAWGTCPYGGQGGAGVVADTLFMADSTVVGGRGAEGYNAGETWSYCGRAPDGPPWFVHELNLLADDDLAASGELSLGGTWTLTWNKRDPFTLLVIAVESSLAPQPSFLGPSGWAQPQPAAGARSWPGPAPSGSPGAPSFLDPGPSLVLGFPRGMSSFALTPRDPELLGLTVTAQVLGPKTGLSRPVTDTVRP